MRRNAEARLQERAIAEPRGALWGRPIADLLVQTSGGPVCARALGR